MLRLHFRHLAAEVSLGRELGQVFDDRGLRRNRVRGYDFWPGKPSRRRRREIAVHHCYFAHRLASLVMAMHPFGHSAAQTPQPLQNDRLMMKRPSALLTELVGQ
jgi:hypothetical protein